MSYLKTLGEALTPMLETHDVSAAGREEIIAFVKKAALQSYKNGLRDAEKPKPDAKGAPRAKRA